MKKQQKFQVKFIKSDENLDLIIKKTKKFKCLDESCWYGFMLPLPPSKNI